MGDMTPAPESAAPAPAPVSSSAAPASADTPAPSGHAPTAPATQPDTTGDKPSPGLFKDLSDAEQRYKNLQRYAAQMQSRYQSLGDFGELQKQREFLAQLREDPDFVEWARGKVARQTAGSDDPETVKALGIIEAIAEEKAGQLLAERVGPLEEAAFQAKTQTTFAKMHETYGPEWEQMKPKMLEILHQGYRDGTFNPYKIERGFDLGFVKRLYAMAIADDPQFAAKAYASKLAQKKATATEPAPGTPPAAVGLGKINSIRDAFAAAKQAAR